MTKVPTTLHLIIRCIYQQNRSSSASLCSKLLTYSNVLSVSTYATYLNNVCYIIGFTSSIFNNIKLKAKYMCFVPMNFCFLDSMENHPKKTCMCFEDHNITFRNFITSSGARISSKYYFLRSIIRYYLA